MSVSFEAVRHSPSSGVAQPQSSMKESHPAKLHLQEVDQTATASSTSNKSTSLQLLLLLHTMAGVAALRRRNGGSGTARARCSVQDAAAVKTGTCRDVMAVYPTRCWPQQPPARAWAAAPRSCRNLPPHPLLIQPYVRERAANCTHLRRGAAREVADLFTHHREKETDNENVFARSTTDCWTLHPVPPWHEVAPRATPLGHARWCAPGAGLWPRATSRSSSSTWCSGICAGV